MFVKSNWCIPDKSTLHYCSVVACACELITLLFSVVFCPSRFVRRFDCRLDRTWTPSQWRHAVTEMCRFWQAVLILLVSSAQDWGSSGAIKVRAADISCQYCHILQFVVLESVLMGNKITLLLSGMWCLVDWYIGIGQVPAQLCAAKWGVWNL
jgi:hypothetical protein